MLFDISVFFLSLGYASVGRKTNIKNIINVMLCYFLEKYKHLNVDVHFINSTSRDERQTKTVERVCF